MNRAKQPTVKAPFTAMPISMLRLSGLYYQLFFPVSAAILSRFYLMQRQKINRYQFIYNTINQNIYN